MDARLGDPHTVQHYVLFVAGLLILTIEYEQIHVARNLARGFVGELGIGTHPHQFIFPLVLSLLGIKSVGWWMFYPSLLLVAVPAFWLFLAKYHRVPLAVCSIIGWSVYFSPFVTHIGIYANGDVLTNIAALLLALCILWRPGSAVLAGICFVLLLLMHQRGVLLAPGYIAFTLYCSGRTGTKAMLQAVVPYAVAAVVFLAFKTGYYHAFPLQENQYPLEIEDQLRRMFRLPGALGPMEGGVFDYFLHVDNLRFNGLFYFSFALLAYGGWRLRQPWLAASALLLYAGTVVQLFVAEDAHRLTGFLFVITVLLAVEAQRPQWPIPSAVRWFFPISFASVLALNPVMGLPLWSKGLRRMLEMSGTG